MKNSNN